MKIIICLLGTLFWLATVGCQTSRDNPNAQGGYGGYGASSGAAFGNPNANTVPMSAGNPAEDSGGPWHNFSY